MANLAKRLGWDESPPVVPAPVPAPIIIQPNEPSMPLQPSVTELYDDWNTQAHAYHNTRVLCDRAGLSLDHKNVLSACIWQESTFKNTALNRNRDSAGNVLSSDWGIAQVNDHYHIGAGKDFPSVQYVLDNPEAVIDWMIGIYKRTDGLSPWVSYSSGAYLHWLSPGSPMWALKTE